MQTALTRCRSPELRSVDRAAGELCTVELDGAAVQALPGHHRVLPEVPGDDTYHRVFRLLGGSGCTAELIRLASWSPYSSSSRLGRHSGPAVAPFSNL